MPNIKRGIAAQRLRAAEVFNRLQKTYPGVHCTLDYHSPMQLLMMTILAAQCTDERVNIVSKTLFKKYRKPQDFIDVASEELEKDIHSCGFFRQKTKSIKATAQDLIEKYEGKVPGTMEELNAMRGVGRKTANVLLGECFGKQVIIVDTHCTRVSNRLGFTKTDDAGKIEQDLMKVWPPEHWTEFSHLMVFHGRAICIARAPKCSECPVYDLCPFPQTREGKKIAR